MDTENAVRWSEQDGVQGSDLIIQLGVLKTSFGGDFLAFLTPDEKAQLYFELRADIEDRVRRIITNHPFAKR